MLQKPIEKAYEPRLVECHPAIARCGKTEGAEIHRGDGARLCSDDVRGGSYTTAGKTPKNPCGQTQRRSFCDVHCDESGQGPPEGLLGRDECRHPHYARLLCCSIRELKFRINNAIV